MSRRGKNAILLFTLASLNGILDILPARSLSCSPLYLKSRDSTLNCARPSRPSASASVRSPACLSSAWIFVAHLHRSGSPDRLHDHMTTERGASGVSGFIPACTVVMVVHQMVKFNSIGQRSTVGKIKVMTCVETISSSGRAPSTSALTCCLLG